MKAVIIGSGNVATALAKALYSAHVPIAQIWSLHHEHAAILAGLVKAEVILELSAIDLDADCCIISVKDDAIAPVVAQLQGFKGIIVHTSGSVGLEVFENRFENYGAFYPLQTFSKAREISFGTIPLCLEANNEGVLAQLRMLAGKLSSNIREVSSEQRRILHLAAVFACNFPNHLYAMAANVLNGHGLDFDILRPLILETALKVQESLPIQVQTGPAIRCDEETMAKHEALLAEKPSYLEIYKILSDSIKKTR